MKVALNKEVFRQTPDQPYAHFAGSGKKLCRIVERNFDKAEDVNGAEGVKVVPVPPKGFFTPVVSVENGDNTTGLMEPHITHGRKPRPMMIVERKYRKAKANYAKVIIKSHKALADKASHSDADWEIIGFNAYLKEGEPEHFLSIADRAYEQLFCARPETVSAEDEARKVAEDRKLLIDFFESYGYWRHKALVLASFQVLNMD